MERTNPHAHVNFVERDALAGGRLGRTVPLAVLVHYATQWSNGQAI
jgi:hypothetical protein